MILRVFCDSGTETLDQPNLPVILDQYSEHPTVTASGRENSLEVM